MPRGPRLDAPGALHHVMVRGIEGRDLFRDAADRRDWVQRLAKICAETHLSILAWAVLSNHAHVLVRTGDRPLATAMRRLLTGYAGAFNRRHRRRGRLFQNRYKSIVVEEERYLLELVRYIHLNPLRAGVVGTLAALDRFPWTGHSALLGRNPYPWQAVREILARFGARTRRARWSYRAFVAAGIPLGRRPELQGGGLRRSAGGWEIVGAMRRGREHGLADERVLGSGAFVEAMQRLHAQPEERAVWAASDAEWQLLLGRCARAWGVTLTELTRGSRRRPAAEARAVASTLAVRDLGLPIVEVARRLGVSEGAVRRGISRGDTVAAKRGVARSEFLPRQQ
jgi:putative transposase